eukprot:10980928-Heterocapsa_arctica.AAC.1
MLTMITSKPSLRHIYFSCEKPVASRVSRSRKTRVSRERHDASRVALEKHVRFSRIVVVVV